MGDAVAYAQPALDAEAVAGNEQQLMCLRGLGESLSVGFERANPQVECALGCHALVAELRKAAIQGFAVLRIGLNIARLVDAALDDVLQKRRRAHEAKRAAGRRTRR